MRNWYLGISFRTGRERVRTGFSLVFFPAALIVAYLVQDRTVLVQDRPAPIPA